MFSLRYLQVFQLFLFMINQINQKVKMYIFTNYINLFGIAIAILLSFIANVIRTDYGYFGVLAIFLFYLFRNNKVLMNLSFIFLVFIFYSKFIFIPTFTIRYLIISACTILPLIFINLYNHKKGKDTKYFLYLFYPIHLLIIYALHLLFV